MKTKTTLFIMLLLLIQGVANAQEVFPDGNIEWYSVMEYVENGLPPAIYPTYNHYTSREIVTIEGVEYRAVYQLYDNTSEEVYSGAYRVDNEAKKVYFYGKEDTQERLIYDFTLEIGDSFSIETPNFGPLNLSCWEIDSLEMEDGSKRKRLYMSHEFKTALCDQVWVEGIGGTINPLFDTYLPLCSVDFTQWVLSCFYIDEERYYYWGNNEYGCDLVGINEPFAQQGKYKITPNPVTAFSTVTSESANSDIFHYMIVDAVGVCVERHENLKLSEIGIDRRILAAGLYVLQLQNRTTGEKANLKFIVK